MGSPSASLRLRLSILAAACAGLLALPAVAAADCTLPGASDVGIDPADEVVFQGNFKPDLNGQFVQIPFEVPAGTKGLRIRYCYDGSGTTLDLGVYGARSGADWTMDDLRGWSGSAIKVAGIGENGYTDEATYDANRKAYVPGRTNRAFTPGPIDPGLWAIELGAGWIDPSLTEGTNWKVGVTPSDDAATWADDPFQPDPYQPYVANPSPGWYVGDLHVHGEGEPGNAPMRETLDRGFGALPAGSGLDFMTLVDHNNTNARLTLGGYEAGYPGKLIIPGAEITTYDGHLNSQNLGSLVDFRMSEIHRFPVSDTSGGGPITLDQSALATVRGPGQPSTRFAEIRQLGGWGQVNHPETFKHSPAACRGCAWTYTDEQTGLDQVDAIEIANGVAGLPSTAPTVMNPFTPPAVEYYERVLAAGNRIAAVGSSDDHRAGENFGKPGSTDPVVGQGATAVYAKELSPGAITQAVRAGHTYVKVFGPDSPDVLLTASTPEGRTGIPGDSIAGERLDLSVEVKGAASNSRPGEWRLSIVKDGIPVEEVPVTGDGFTHAWSTAESGRYSFKLTRKPAAVDLLEAYSTPVWFTYEKSAPKPSNKFSFGKLKLNRKKGTATLKVKAAGAGKVTLKPGKVKKSAARATAKRRTVTLRIVPKAKLRKKLRKRGRAKLRVKVAFAPDGGQARTKSRAVTLKQKARPRRR